MKRSYKIAIIAGVFLILLYTLSYFGLSLKYGYTWLNAVEALKSLGVALGISALVFIIAFLSCKWLEESA